MFIILSIFLMSLFSSAQDSFGDFYFAPKSKDSTGFLENTVVGETGNYFIVSNSWVNFYGNDYYLVTSESPDLTAEIKQNFKVEADTGRGQLIIKKELNSDIVGVTEKLHTVNRTCGSLIKIFPSVLQDRDEFLPIRGITHNVLKPIVDSIAIDPILERIKELSDWPSRYHTHSFGEKIGQKIKKIYEDMIPEGRHDVSVKLFSHAYSRQKSVIVTIAGEKPERVILGSHIDSISKDSERAPGADDNATGTAVNMEVFKKLMAMDLYPKKTIEIHGYAIEEVGLVGSQEIAKQYRLHGIPVRSLLQLDMMGYVEDQPKMNFATNSTSSLLTRELVQLAKTYSGIPVTSGHSGSGTSDHWAWNQQGFHVAFPSEDPIHKNKKIHSSEDSFDNINGPQQILGFARLALAYIVQYSSQ